MSSAEAKNLEVISKAIDEHNVSCEWPAVAVEMNPFEVERLGWDEIRGLPIRPNADLGPGSFRIVCAREEGQLRHSFLAMVRLTDDDKWVRHVTRWDEHPRSIHPILEQFVAARLLVSGGDPRTSGTAGRAAPSRPAAGPRHGSAIRP